MYNYIDLDSVSLNGTAFTTTKWAQTIHVKDACGNDQHVDYNNNLEVVVKEDGIYMKGCNDDQLIKIYDQNGVDTRISDLKAKAREIDESDPIKKLVKQELFNLLKECGIE